MLHGTVFSKRVPLAAGGKFFLATEATEITEWSRL